MNRGRSWDARLLGVYGAVVGSLSLLWVMQTGADRRASSVDSMVLIAGQDLSLKCMSDHVFVNCYGHLSDQFLLSKFPLLQTIPAWIIWWFTRAHEKGQPILVVLNAVVLATGIIAFVVWAWRRYGRHVGVLALVLSVAGMVIPYATYTFGEPLGLVALGAVCVVAMGRWHTSRWLIVLTALAVMGKETFFPAVLLFGMGSLMIAPCTNAVRFRRAKHLVIGVAIGFGLASIYNLFRYGSPRNVGYADEPFTVPGEVPRNALGQLISPNGGIAWFWPGVLISLGIIVAFAVRRQRTEEDRLVRRGVVMVIGGFAFGLLLNAVWWGPYGWYAWGPRLLFPYCAPVVIVAIALVGRSGDLRWFHGWRILTVGILCSLVLLPSFGVVWMPERWVSHLDEQQRVEPECDATQSPTWTDSARCQRDAAWRTSSMPLVSVIPMNLEQPSYWLVVIGGIASIWALLGSVYEPSAHRRARTPRRLPRSRPPPRRPSSEYQHEYDEYEGDEYEGDEYEGDEYEGDEHEGEDYFEGDEYDDGGGYDEEYGDEYDGEDELVRV